MTNKTNTDTLEKDNKKLMDIIINNQIAQDNELQRINNTLKSIISSPEYENNKINIQKRRELQLISKSSVNTAQEIINNCEDLS